MNFSRLATFTLSATLFSIASQSVEAKPVASKAATAQVAFQTFDSYYESNQSGLTGSRSLLVLNSQKSFDRVFGAAATMNSQNFLPDNSFNSKMVLAVIKRGKSITKYQVQSVSARGNRLVIRYSASGQAQSSATFASPLIVAIPRKPYRSVVFVENGQILETVKVK